MWKLTSLQEIRLFYSEYRKRIQLIMAADFQASYFPPNEPHLQGKKATSNSFKFLGILLNTFVPSSWVLMTFCSGPWLILLQDHKGRLGRHPLDRMRTAVPRHEGRLSTDLLRGAAEVQKRLGRNSPSALPDFPGEPGSLPLGQWHEPSASGSRRSLATGADFDSTGGSP